MKHTKVVIHKIGENRWTLTIDGVRIPNVIDVRYERGGATFPVVTFSIIGELYQDDKPMDSVDSFAPWRADAPQ